MSVNNQPTNYNFLSPLGYKFVLSRAPNIEYFTQRVTLPDVTLPVAMQSTGFQRIPRPGDKLEFGQLSITFKVNENLDNYLEIFNWMAALGRPESFNQYTLSDRPYKATDEQKDTTVSDITVTLLSSAMNGNIEFLMRDCFPTSLTNIEGDSTLTEVEYVTATATFAVRDFTITKI
jgi:hypothetical protein